jgi:hypothetical protein
MAASTRSSADSHGTITSLRLPPWRYPIFQLKALARAFFLRLAREIPLTKAASDDDWITRTEDLPPALMQFQRGELLKWKGIEFRVLKVVGNPSPALILVPTRVTHGKIVNTYRAVRREQVKDARDVDS